MRTVAVQVLARASVGAQCRSRSEGDGEGFEGGKSDVARVQPARGGESAFTRR
jgi:hypothetical protein